MDPFVGHVIEHENCTYTILQHNGLKGSKRKYLIDCSVCSKDSDMFPEIWSRKGDILANKQSCACSKRYSFTGKQYEILCLRKCAEFNLSFVGINNGDCKVGHKTKMTFVDQSGEVISKMSIDHFLHRYDPSKSKNIIKCDSDYYSEKLKSKFVEGTKFYRIGRTNQFKVFCPVCSENSLCTTGVTSPWFDSTYSNILIGSKPCFCSGRYNYNQDEYKHRIQSVLTTGKFLDFVGNFDGNQTKFEWVCDCGSHNIQTISDFLYGKRCASCAKGGFNPSLPATLYLCVWSGMYDNFMKVGITNRDPLTRLEEQRKQSTCKITSLTFYYFESGFEAKKMESHLLSMFPKFQPTLDKFDDGKTEVISNEHYDTLLKVMENYGFKYYKQETN